MRTKRSVDRRRRADNLKGWALIGATSVFLGGLTWAFVNRPTSPCEEPPSVVYGVLIDATSTLSEAQRLDIVNKLAAFVGQMPVGARLQFWQVAPTGVQVPAPLSDPICKPSIEPNQWFENVAQVKKAAADFDAEVSRLIGGALVSGSQPESPILEGIQAVSLRFLATPEFSGAKDRRLMLVSDLLQHTRNLSFYNGVPTFEVLKGNPNYQRLRVALSGTGVEMLFLKQDDGSPATPLIQLWDAVFADMGATVKRIDRVTG